MHHLKNADKLKLSIKKLDSLMQNQGVQQFNFDTFKAAYDANPKIKELVRNFDTDTIELSTGDAIDELPTSDADTDSDVVSRMAKSATDVSSM